MIFDGTMYLRFAPPNAFYALQKRKNDEQNCACNH